MLHLDNQLQRASADILEPSGVSEHPLKFMAGLTVAVTLVAQINEVENIQDVRIKVWMRKKEIQVLQRRKSDR